MTAKPLPRAGLSTGLAACLTLGGALAMALSSGQAASPAEPNSEQSQARTENIFFVRTVKGAPTGEIEGQSERFNQIIGSGRLLINPDNQVTGYYFTVSGLEPNQTLPYHFHSVRSGATSTSCEGDKDLLDDETAGEVITPLSQTAPLRSTASGLGTVGTASNPIQLPNPVPLKDIGYLNIHANDDPESGIGCANVPLKPVKFEQSAQTLAPGTEPQSPVTPQTETQPSITPGTEARPVTPPRLTVEPTPEPSPETKTQAPLREPDVVYVPTSEETVEQMLALAKVTKNDVLYDLGSGDGRIPIAAAQKYGTRGVGIDIDPQRVQEANVNAQKAGVTDLVEFRNQDLFKSNFSEATVVTLYLLSELNLKLRPELFRQLKPGTRIVSHNFDMGDWKPERAVQTSDGSTIYLWIIPKEVPANLR